MLEVRPWGSFVILDESDKYKIKKVTVNPKSQLSLQLHHHRSEHWVVVKGMAEVICDGRVFFVRVGESTYIPSSTKHRLANPGVIPLEVIEIEIGDYLKEDDIVRFEDKSEVDDIPKES